MRTLTFEEMNLVTGATGDSNKPVPSGDFRSALIGWAVSEGMNMAVSQINAYVAAYERDGLAGVIAAAPGTQAALLTAGFISSLTNPEQPEQPKDGGDYCADGGNY